MWTQKIQDFVLSEKALWGHWGEAAICKPEKEASKNPLMPTPWLPHEASKIVKRSVSAVSATLCVLSCWPAVLTDRPMLNQSSQSKGPYCRKAQNGSMSPGQSVAETQASWPTPAKAQLEGSLKNGLWVLTSDLLQQVVWKISTWVHLQNSQQPGHWDGTLACWFWGVFSFLILRSGRGRCI